MRLIFLILFVGTVLTEEQITKEVEQKVDDVKGKEKSIEETKSKTEKRDSSDQIGSYALNTNDEPFKPMFTDNTAAYEVAASATQQQVYYDKNQVTADENAKAKGTINRQAAANAYREPHSQVVYQQQQEQYQQQQQLNKNPLRVAGKNAGIQNQNQQSILYAAPHNAAYNYERIPQQQQQQQFLQQHISVQPQAGQRGQQKQLQYVIAIPFSYLRQLQQQLLYQQQQEQSSSSHLQANNAQQQQQQPAHVTQQQQQQQQPHYSIVGPLARDNHGAYRPFHRFSPTAVNDASAITSGQHQQPISPPLIPAGPAPPGYITQYIQIPASVLLAAAQTAQVQQRPLNIQHQSGAYQQQQSAQQQHTQAQSPQLYYYQPQQNQHHQLQQQQQLKQSQNSHVLSPSPHLYEYNVQQQQPSQQQHILQHSPEYQHLQQQQQQQSNVGKQQQHRFEGVRPNANLAAQSPQHGATTYEHEQAHLAALHAQTHAQTHYNALLHAHQQPTQQQAQVSQSPATGHKLVQAITPAQQQHQQQQHASTEPYEHLVHYNPQYYLQQQQQHQHHQQQERVKYQQPLHPQHRLQIQHPPPPQHQQHQLQQEAPLSENLNYLSYSQGIQGPTALPFIRLPAGGAVAPHMASQPSQLTPYYNYNLIPPAMHQPFVANALQPSFAPLGMPSKVTSFTNVLLQPFVGHPSSYQTPEMGHAGAASTDSLPFFNHHTGGIHYGTHLYHPPTPATAIASSKQLNPAAAPAKPAPRSASVASAGEPKHTAKPSSKATAGSQTLVKYP